jgi:hypothetical protein
VLTKVQSSISSLLIQLLCDLMKNASEHTDRPIELVYMTAVRVL